MYLTFNCPRCGTRQRSQKLSGPSELTCRQCDWTRTIQVPEPPLTECQRCGNADLWRQKNFPQWLGLSFVALGALLSSVAWARHQPVLALGILMGFALLDMVLYLTMPDILVCYRCRTQHHTAETSQHAGFNHELAERYRQEGLRHARAAAQSEHGDPSAPLASG